MALANFPMGNQPISAERETSNPHRDLQLQCKWIKLSLCVQISPPSLLGLNWPYCIAMILQLNKRQLAWRKGIRPLRIIPRYDLLYSKVLRPCLTFGQVVYFVWRQTHPERQHQFQTERCARKPKDIFGRRCSKLVACLGHPAIVVVVVAAVTLQSACLSHARSTKVIFSSEKKKEPSKRKRQHKGSK